MTTSFQWKQFSWIDVMALDFNSVKFLFWARKLGVSFNRTLTLGHLGLPCPPRKMHQAVRDFQFPANAAEVDNCFRMTFGKELYADEFFKLLGAKELVSVDRSDYEAATLLHDLNEPFPTDLRGRFDLVMDGGTLEHIFDYPSALRHCLQTVSVGGHFITITPANQYMGHGFYQFSPELFFRVFAAQNGFALRKIVIFECFKADAAFYEVTDPAVSGWRVQLVDSPAPMMLAVLAQKTAEVPLFNPPPQQSDYAAEWSRRQQKAAEAKPAPSGFFHELRVKVNPYWPYWLRQLKFRLSTLRRPDGPPSLRNKRHFRRLSHGEITGEKSSP
jgi:hypothetical protein